MKHRHALVTGASSGIGAEIAKALSERGVAVTLVARRAQKLEELAAGLPGASFVRPADLSDTSECERVIADATEALGPIDLLINNAGVQYVEPMIDVTPERSRFLFDVDLHSPMRLMNQVVRELVERGEAGHVVNVCSLAALVHTPGMGHYSAAKAALAAASETMRAEVAHLNIGVLTVYPGPVSTPMESMAREAYGDATPSNVLPTGDAGELARRIIKSLNTGVPRLIYPSAYRVTRHVRPFAQWVSEKGAVGSIRSMLGGRDDD